MLDKQYILVRVWLHILVLVVPKSWSYYVSSTNMVVDGDFESFNLVGVSPYYFTQETNSWYQESNMVFEIQKIQTPPVLATQSCDLSSNYSNTLCQNIILTANKIYEVNMDVVFKFALNKYGTVGMYVGGNLAISLTGTSSTTSSVLHGTSLILPMVSSVKLCVREINPMNPTVWAGPDVDNISLFEVVDNETSLISIPFIISQDTYIQLNLTRNTSTLTITTNYTITYACIPSVFSQFVRIVVQDVEVGNSVFRDVGGLLTIQVDIPVQYVGSAVYVYVGLPIDKVRVGDIWGYFVGRVGVLDAGIEGLQVQYLATQQLFMLTHIHNHNNGYNTTNITNNNTTTNTSNTNNTNNNTNTPNNTPTSTSTSTTNNTIPHTIISTIIQQINLYFYYEVLEIENTLVIVTNYKQVYCKAGYGGCLAVFVEDAVVDWIVRVVGNYLVQQVLVEDNETTLQFIAKPKHTTNIAKLTQHLQHTNTLLYSDPQTSTNYYLNLQYNPPTNTITTSYYYSLSSPEVTYTQQTQAIYIIFINVFNKIYPFLSSGLCSYFLVKLLTFWNISFLYVCLPLRSMPNFLYRVVTDITAIYYSDMNFIQFYKYLSTGRKQPYKIYLTSAQQQQHELEASTNNKNQLKLITNNLSISTDFLNDNIEDLSILALLICKLAVLYLLRHALQDKLQVVVGISKLWYWFAMEVVVSLPFFVMSSLCRFMMMGSFNFVSRINTLLHTLLIFAIIAIMTINYLNSHQQKQKNTPSQQTTQEESTHPAYNKISSNNFLLDVLLCTMVPVLLIIGNNIAFFIFVLMYSLGRLVYVCLHYKCYSGWQLGKMVLMCGIWIMYNLLWFALFMSQKYHNEDKTGQIPSLKYCGYAIIFLLLLGGFVELVTILIDIIKSIIDCIKHILKLAYDQANILKKKQGIKQPSTKANSPNKSGHKQRGKQVLKPNHQNMQEDKEQKQMPDQEQTKYTRPKQSKKTLSWMKKLGLKSTRNIKQQKNHPQHAKMKIKTTKNRVDEFIKSTPNTQEVVNNSKTLKCRTSIQVKEEVADCDGGEIFYVPVVYANIFEK